MIQNEQLVSILTHFGIDIAQQVEGNQKIVMNLKQIIDEKKEYYEHWKGVQEKYEEKFRFILTEELIKLKKEIDFLEKIYTSNKKT